MTRKLGYLAMFFLFLMFTFFAVGKVLAYENIINGDTKINGGLGVDGDLYVDHNNLFFNPLGWPSVDPTIDFKVGDSQIKEMGDLYILSDDYVHIGSSLYDIGKVLIQNPAEISSRAITASGWLAAGTLETNDLLVNNNASVGGILLTDGTLAFGSGTIADFTNASILGFGVGGMTLGGDLDMDGYNINNVGGINVNNNAYFQSSIDVDGTGYFDNGLDVTGANLVVGPFNVNYITGGISTTGQAWINGGFSVNGAFIADSSGNLTVNGTSNFKDALYNSIGNLTVNDSLDVLGPLMVTGDTNIKGFVYNSTGDFEINDNAIVEGTLTTETILPETDNLYNVGAYNKRYFDGYFGNSLIIGTTDSAYTQYGATGPLSYGIDLSLYSGQDVNVIPAGAVYLHPGFGNSYSYNLYPDGASYNLGASGQEWAYGYFNDMEVAGGFGAGSGAGTTIDTGVYTNGSLYVDNGAEIRGNIVNNNGDVTIDDSLSQTGSGQVTFSGNVDANSGLDIIGNLTLTGNISDSDSPTLTIADSLQVNGGIALAGAIFDPDSIIVTINDGLIVTGAVDLQGDIINSTGDVYFDDNVYVASTLSVSGLATLDGGIDVGSISAFTVDTSGNVFAAGTLNVLGVVTANGGITVDNTLFNANTLDSGDNYFTIDSGLADIYLTGANINVLGILNATGGISAGAPIDLIINAGLGVPERKIILGNASLGDIDLMRNTNIYNGLDVIGALTVSTTSTFSGVVNANSGIAVDAPSNLNIDAAFSGGIDTYKIILGNTSTGDIDLMRNTNALAGLDVTGVFTSSSTGSFAGVLYANGGIAVDAPVDLTINAGGAQKIILGNTSTGDIDLKRNTNALAGLDISGGDLSFTGTAGSWVMALLDSALTQTGTGQVTFTGNVDARNGLDVTGADLTASGYLVDFSGATYLKIPTRPTAPAASDCDSQSELGQMTMVGVSGGDVYICTYKQGSIGWDTVNLTD